MKTVGVICEYNPFHNGHKKQFAQIRAACGEDASIICLMSGNYVQRGEPARFDRFLRAEAALRSGANLVLELPVTYSLRSAEGFASGGIEILSRICDVIAFGCENPEAIPELADTMLTDAYEEVLRSMLAAGKSYAAATEAALERLGMEGALLRRPNNILAVEYVKAVRKAHSKLELLPLKREGSYHDAIDPDNPSAEQLRKTNHFSGSVPEELLSGYESAGIYTREAGERAVLARLRSLTDEERDRLPYASEGLWNKIHRAIEEGGNLEEITEYAKSRRYPYTRIARMLMCAYLGISDELLFAPAPYIRALGCRAGDTQLLKTVSGVITILHPGEKAEASAYNRLEARSLLLYQLFLEPDSPGEAAQKQVFRIV